MRSSLRFLASLVATALLPSLASAQAIQADPNNGAHKIEINGSQTGSTLPNNMRPLTAPQVPAGGPQTYHGGNLTATSLLLYGDATDWITLNGPLSGGAQTFSFPTSGGTLATTNYVLSQAGSYLPLAGVTMTGAINGLQAGTTLGTGTPVAGGVYRDNQILASGFVEGNALSVVTGNVTLTHVSAGLYELDFAVPVTGIQHPLTVTPDACCNADAPSTATVQWISLSPLQYYVRTYGFNSGTHVFTQEDYNFTFILVP